MIVTDRIHRYRDVSTSPCEPKHYLRWRKSQLRLTSCLRSTANIVPIQTCHGDSWDSNSKLDKISKFSHHSTSEISSNQWHRSLKGSTRRMTSMRLFASKYGQTLELLNSKLSSKPSDEKLLYSKGIVLMNILQENEAVDNSPIDEESFSLELSNIKNKAQYAIVAEALSIFSKLVQMNPQSDSVWYNLASLYELYLNNKEEDAVKAYQEVIKATTNEKLKYACYNNIISIYFRTNKLDDAGKVCDVALNAFPDSALLWCTTGIVLRENKSFDYSKVCLERADSLVKAKYKRKSKTETKKGFGKKADDSPYDDDDKSLLETVHSNLAYVYKILENIDQAAISLRAASELSSSESVSYLQELGQLYADNNRIQEAIDAFSECLRLGVSDSAMEVYIQYQLAALRGNDSSFTSAPKEYVEQLFDFYATANYDDHMIENLKYMGPEVIFRSFRQSLNKLLERSIVDSTFEEKLWSNGTILEIGTGTGLVGIRYREEGFNGVMIGSDISKNMMEISSRLLYEIPNTIDEDDSRDSDGDSEADIKPVYDQVDVCDSETFLKKQPDNVYDAVVAGDVLCYFGRLDEIFTETRRCIKPNTGMFTFTVELLPESEDFSASYKLQSTARYSHTKNYVRSLAKEIGFDIICMEEVTLRTQGLSPVIGLAVTIRRNS